MKYSPTQKPALRREIIIPRAVADPAIPQTQHAGLSAEEHTHLNGMQRAEVSEDLPSEPSIPLNIRAAGPADLNFILSAWMKSFRHELNTTYIIDPIFFPAQQRLIQKIAQRPGCVLALAVSTEDPDHILGFVVAEPAAGMNETYTPLVVHYVYVKHAFRGFGVATKLLEYVGWVEGEDIIATHITYSFTKNNRLAMKELRILYNPYVLVVDGWVQDYVKSVEKSL